MNDRTRGRRWFRFSLRTMFVVLTLAAVAAFWLHHLAVRQRAREECDRTFASWDAAVVTSEQACEASLRCFNAEVAVPFADRRKAAASHLARVQRVKVRDYGPYSEWLMGVRNETDLAEAKARKAKIEAYCREAERMVADFR